MNKKEKASILQAISKFAEVINTIEHDDKAHAHIMQKVRAILDYTKAR